MEGHDVTQETMHLDPELGHCATEPVHTGIRMELALEVLSALLGTEEGAMALLKDRHREAKVKQKRQIKRALKREKKSKECDHPKGTSRRSYSSSASSLASLGTSNSSSDGGPRATSSSSSAPSGPNDQRVFETTQHAPGAPAFVSIKGEPHFRIRNLGDPVNCACQPKTPCCVYGHCHWYRQGGAYNRRGWFAKRQ